MPHPFFPKASACAAKDVERLYNAVQRLQIYCNQTSQDDRIRSINRRIGGLNHESSKTFDRGSTIRDLERFFLLMELKALEIGKGQISTYLSEVDAMSIETNTKNNENYFGVYSDIQELWDWDNHCLILDLMTKVNLDLGLTFLINFERLNPDFTYYDNFDASIEAGLIPKPQEPELPKRLMHNSVEIRTEMLQLVEQIPNDLIEAYLNDREKTGYAAIDSTKGKVSLNTLKQDSFQNLFLELIKACGRDHDYRVKMDSEFREIVYKSFVDLLHKQANHSQISQWITLEFESQLIELLVSDYLIEMNWYFYQADLVRELIKPISSMLSINFLIQLFSTLETIDKAVPTLDFVKSQELYSLLGTAYEEPTLSETHYGAGQDLFALVLDNWQGDLEPFYASELGSAYLVKLNMKVLWTFKFNDKGWYFDIPRDNTRPQPERTPLAALFKALEVESRAKEFCKALVAVVIRNSIKHDRKLTTYTIDYQTLNGSFLVNSYSQVPKCVKAQLATLDTGSLALDAFVRQSSSQSRVLELSNHEDQKQVYREALKLWIEYFCSDM